jgi:hypothetical protein
MRTSNYVEDRADILCFQPPLNADKYLQAHWDIFFQLFRNPFPTTWAFMALHAFVTESCFQGKTTVDDKPCRYLPFVCSRFAAYASVHLWLALAIGVLETPIIAGDSFSAWSP